MKDTKAFSEISERILRRAIENNEHEKCSGLYDSKELKGVASSEFQKGMTFFNERIKEVGYDKFSASYTLPETGKRKAVAISAECA